MVKVRENRVPMMLTNEELTEIEDWRFANRVATRSDAIRRMCKLALVIDKRSKDLELMNLEAKAQMAALAASLEVEDNLGDEFASLMLKDFQAASFLLQDIKGKEESDPVQPVTQAFVAALLAVNDFSRAVMELSDAADTVRSPKKLDEISHLLSLSQALYDRMLGRELNSEMDKALPAIFDRPQFAGRKKPSN